jgi:Leucine-rich repeat (LRR) protein
MVVTLCNVWGDCMYYSAVTFADQNVPQAEIGALNDLFLSTNGSNWTWQSAGLRWNFTDDPSPCSGWQGVTCTAANAQQTYRHISQLNLPSYNLVGRLPASLGSLNQLTLLVLADNHLAGAVPDALGAGLRELKRLNLGNNEMIGTIPLWLGNLHQLAELDLSDNYFNGTIPAGWDSVMHLADLRLNLNWLTGSIPDSWVNVTALQHFDLYGNALTGTVPTWVANCTALVYLDLSYNQLHGTIPPSLGGLPVLEVLYLNDNELTGAVPSQLGNLTGLVVLALSTNDLSGQIPSTLGNCAELTDLWLYNNELSGPLPDSLAALSVLEILYLTSNKLSGPIPDDLGSLASLLELDLHYNSFTGTAPDSLGSLSLLQHFDISYNFLTGTISAAYAQMASLQLIGVDDCYFTGTLPALSPAQSSLALIQFEHNLLTGTVSEGYGSLVGAQELMLTGNILTGSLPPSLANLRDLFGLFLGDNFFTGCLPAFGRLPLLQVLHVQGNKLGCSLDAVFNSSLQWGLADVRLQYNQFTGPLPVELFKAPLLTTVVAISNCFTGTLPLEVCNPQLLQALVLDGLHAAPACHNKISSLSRAYTVTKGFHGTIPACLFNLPQLSCLHLSGCDLTGTLPATAVLNTHFTELALSHNSLTGTLSAFVQTHPWSVLDVSYNLFSGSLDATFGAAQAAGQASTPFNSSTLYVQNNRLSGSVPVPLRHLHNVSALESNLFSCAADKSDLPAHNPGVSNYQCGSNAFNAPYYTLLGAVAALCLCAGCLRWSLLPSAARVAEHLNKWNVPVLDLSPACQRLHTAVQVLCEVGIVLTALIVVVLVPWYAAASVYYGTYTRQYAYELSAAFLSGLTPGLTEFFLFTALVCVLGGTAWVLTSSTRRRGLLSAAQGSAGSEAPLATLPHARVKAYCAFLLVNLTVVVGVNVAFVAASLRASNAVLNLTQILLSLFKLSWNSVCVPRLIEATAGHSGQQDRSVVFFALQVFVALFNNIAIPCLIVAVLSPSCFYSVFDAAPAVVSTYVAPTCYFVGGNTECSFQETTNVSTYDPPFSYDYQCSSSFITYYAPTFVYLALTSAIIVPIGHVILVKMHASTAPTSKLHLAVALVLPRGLRRVDAAASDAIAKHRGDKRPYVDANRLLVTLLIYLGIVVTYGVVFPPLAVAMCVAMLSVAWQAKLAAGRLLHNTPRGTELHTVVAARLERDCSGAVSLRKLQSGIFLLVCFACSFYALFLFDTLGDAVGFGGAYWVLIVMPLMPVVLYSARHLSGTHLWPDQKATKDNQVSGNKTVGCGVVELTTTTANAQNIVLIGNEGAGDTVSVLHVGAFV